QGEIHHPQQRGFAGPARPDQEMERAGRQREADFVQDVRPRAVAQQHLVEDDQAAISLPESKRSARMAQAYSASKATLGDSMTLGKESPGTTTRDDGQCGARLGGDGLRGRLGTLWRKESMRRTLQAFDRSGRLARPSYRRLAAEAWAQVV